MEEVGAWECEVLPEHGHMEFKLDRELEMATCEVCGNTYRARA